MGRTYRNRLVWTIVAALFAWMPGVCVAEDLYAVRFFARSGSASGFLLILWEDELLFHNTNTEDRIVTLLGVSNGEPPDDGRQLLVPAGRTARIRGGWSPRGGADLWAVHLDVPAGVVVQSRAEAHSDCFCGRPPSPTPDMGSFSLPVFRALTPANVRQVHLGADLGGERSYVNVGIYNVASAPAIYSIELRQACDDAILDQRRADIPPNSIVQVTGLSGTPSGCPGIQGGSWNRYVKVNVDKPSFSYIVNKKSDLVLPTSVPFNSPH